MARKSKYENQVKKVCGLDFSSHEYNSKARKLRVTTVIKGIIYEYWMSTQTWKNAKESKHSSFNPKGWRFPKYFKVIKEKVQSYLPIPTDKIRLENFFGNLEQSHWTVINDEFGKAFTLKEIKAVYRKYSKRLHPDKNKTINPLEFQTLKALYEIFVEQRKMLVDIVRKNGVDMEY